ncbi:hypothetical protein, partial [Mycoplasmopsis alligatoris]
MLSTEQSKYHYLNQNYLFEHAGWNVVGLVQNPTHKTWRLYMAKIDKKDSKEIATIVQLKLFWEGEKQNKLMAQKDWAGTKDLTLAELEKRKNNLNDILSGDKKFTGETQTNNLKAYKLNYKEKEINVENQFLEKQDKTNKFVTLITLDASEFNKDVNYQDKFLYLQKNYKFLDSDFDV